MYISLYSVVRNTSCSVLQLIVIECSIIELPYGLYSFPDATRHRVTLSTGSTRGQFRTRTDGPVPRGRASGPSMREMSYSHACISQNHAPYCTVEKRSLAWPRG